MKYKEKNKKKTSLTVSRYDMIKLYRVMVLIKIEVHYGEDGSQDHVSEARRRVFLRRPQLKPYDPLAKFTSRAWIIET